MELDRAGGNAGDSCVRADTACSDTSGGGDIDTARDDAGMDHRPAVFVRELREPGTGDTDAADADVDGGNRSDAGRFGRGAGRGRGSRIVRRG